MPDVPAVTIAIPFHDEERYLGAAIQSILSQTFDDFELLLVDDGSRDRSLEIARSVRDPRVRVFSDGVRRHLPARLNEIVRRARGEIIARMDADDVSHETRLARQVEILRSQPSVDAVGTWVGLIDDAEEILGVGETGILPASPKVALEIGILAHASMVARRAWLERHLYDEQLTRAEDRDLWCRTVLSSRFAVVREPLYVVRVSTGSPSFLASYVESQNQNRLLFRRYGPEFVGRLRSLELRALARAKVLAVRGAAATGMLSRLVRRRGREATPAERRMIEDALRRASQRP